jgi:hypothetical protein
MILCCKGLTYLLTYSVVQDIFEKLIVIHIRFDAFPASEYSEVFSGYQPGEVVQFCRDQRFEDHLCPRPQGRRNNLG